MKGFKGFNSKLQCRNYQFEIGKEHEEQGACRCQYGFHFCENPLEVLVYYPPADSRYCEVEGAGEIDVGHAGDTKVAASKLTVKAEIGLPGLIKEGVEYIKSKVDWENDKETNTGDYSAATNVGYQSAATNTGDQSVATNTGNRSASTNTGDHSVATNAGNYSVATNTGYQSVATVEGEDSIACSLGLEGKAKGKKGCWLVLAQWEISCRYRKLLEVKSVLVDGEIIKEDTFYTLVEGQVVEVE